MSATNLYFVMDFINGGELFQHLCKESVFTEERTKFYTASLILAIECLHNAGIVYRDLKPENVLLQADG
jgi:serine/threonine protein kinase